MVKQRQRIYLGAIPDKQEKRRKTIPFRYLFLRYRFRKSYFREQGIYFQTIDGIAPSVVLYALSKETQ